MLTTIILSAIFGSHAFMWHQDKIEQLQRDAKKCKGLYSYTITGIYPIAHVETHCDTRPLHKIFNKK